EFDVAVVGLRSLGADAGAIDDDLAGRHVQRSERLARADAIAEGDTPCARVDDERRGGKIRLDDRPERRACRRQIIPLALRSRAGLQRVLVARVVRFAAVPVDEGSVGADIAAQALSRTIMEHPALAAVLHAFGPGDPAPRALDPGIGAAQP